jgi:alkylhydroperoxidase family enzyme
MSRVPLVQKNQLPEEMRYCLDRPISVLRSLGNAPGALQVHHEFAEWIRWNSKTDPRLRQLLIIAVALCTRSDYEYTHHVALGEQFGVTSNDVENLRAFLNTGARKDFTDAELAAFTLAVQVCCDQDVKEDSWNGLSSYFDVELITEMVVIVTFYVYVATVLRVFRVETEPEYVKYRASV